MKYSLHNLLNEVNYETYGAMIRVTYDSELLVSEVADLIRSIQDVTTVSIANTVPQGGVTTYEIKILTTLSPKEAFIKVRMDAIKLQGIRRFEIATATIQRK